MNSKTPRRLDRYLFDPPGRRAEKTAAPGNEAIVHQAAQAIRSQYGDLVEKLPFQEFLRGRKYGKQGRRLRRDPRHVKFVKRRDHAAAHAAAEVSALLADLGTEGTSTLGLTEVFLALDVDLRSHAITVLSPMPGSPSATAGLRPGDVVEAV